MLVLDNVNALTEKHPNVRDMLRTAQGAADIDLYKVVFVCSGGAAPIQMEGK